MKNIDDFSKESMLNQGFRQGLVSWFWGILGYENVLDEIIKNDRDYYTGIRGKVPIRIARLEPMCSSGGGAAFLYSTLAFVEEGRDAEEAGASTKQLSNQTTKNISRWSHLALHLLARPLLAGEIHQDPLQQRQSLGCGDEC